MREGDSWSMEPILIRSLDLCWDSVTLLVQQKREASWIGIDRYIDIPKDIPKEQIADFSLLNSKIDLL